MFQIENKFNNVAKTNVVKIESTLKYWWEQGRHRGGTHGRPGSQLLVKSEDSAPRGSIW